MAKPQINGKSTTGVLSIIGVGAASGAFAGIGALVVYGLVVTKSTAAMVAAKTALIAGLGGVASSLVLRRDLKRMERSLAETAE
jgi:hypothetical protein